MENNPRISVIILNYNGERFLQKCMESIRKQTYQNHEVVIFDNLSTDGGVKFIRENWTEAKFIESKENLFFAKGNNRAAEQADGDFFFFLNNDTYLHEQCLEKLVASIDPKVGVYAPKMMNYEGTEVIEMGMAIDKYAFPWQNLSNRIFYAEGSGLFISRKNWFEAGGFDEKMVHIAEDLDICWRLLLKGLEIKAVPEAIFYHFGGATLGGTNTVKDKGADTYKTSIGKRYFGERNHLRAVLKNYSAWSLVRILPQMFFWKIGEILFLTVMGKWKIVSQAYLKGLWWNITNLSDTFAERKKIQQTRVRSEKEIRSFITPGNAKLDMFRRVGIPKI